MKSGQHREIPKPSNYKRRKKERIRASREAKKQNGAKQLSPNGISLRGADTDSVWTLPNLVSAARVLLLFPLALATARRQEAAVVAILVGIGLSDWLDGVLARATHQISTVGQIFDPVCDRIAIAGSLIAVVASGYYPKTLALVLLAREVLVSGAALVLAAKGFPRIEVTLLGKAATLMLMFSLPLYVVSVSQWDAARIARILAPLFGYPGAIGYYVAMGHYAFEARKIAAMRLSRE
ncbi:MAG: hypothetical protein C4318_09095 [Acidimicrobiia bacterium]